MNESYSHKTKTDRVIKGAKRAKKNVSYKGEGIGDEYGEYDETLVERIVPSESRCNFNRCIRVGNSRWKLRLRW